MAEESMSTPIGACGNYRVDLQAEEFGACKCGFPKEAHVDKGENKAAQALRKLRETQKIDVNAIDWSNGEGKACKNYRVDVAAKNFGDCKCGFPRDAHVDKGENKAAQALRKLRSTQSAQDNYRPKTGKACNDYKVDMSAEVFGTCLCGRPKDEHVEAEENKASVLLRKLKEKNAAKNEIEDRRAAGEIIPEATPKTAQGATSAASGAITDAPAKAAPGCCVVS